MANENEFRDIHEVPIPEPVLEPMPEYKPKTDLGEDPLEDQASPEVAANAATKIEKVPIRELTEAAEQAVDTGITSELETFIYGLMIEKYLLETRIQELQTRTQELEGLWEVEISDLLSVEQQVQELELQVRLKKRRIDCMHFAYCSSFGKLQDKVEHYPAEVGQTRHTISRGEVLQMTYQE